MEATSPPFITPMIPLSKITLLAALVAPVVASATTIVSDSFTDLGYTDGTDASDVAWFTYYTGAAPTLSVATDATLGGGPALVMNSGSGMFKGAAANFTSQTLAVGDTLTLAFDFRLSETPANNSAGLRFGLANQATTGSAATGTGYYIGLGTGTSSGAAFSGDTGSDSFTSGLGVTPITTNSPGSFSLADQLKHTLSFSVTRTLAGYDLIFSADGGSSYTASDSGSGITNAFNTIVLVQGGVATDFVLDNVNVTLTSVPEPSSYGLLGAGALAACAFVRRRSKRL